MPQVGAFERATELREAAAAADDMAASVWNAERRSSVSESEDARQGSTSSLSIEKIKLCSTIDQRIAKIHDRVKELQASHTKVVEKLERMKKGDASNGAQVEAVMADLVKLQAGATRYLEDTFLGEVRAIRAAVERGREVVTIHNLRTELVAVWKRLNGGDVAAFVEFVRKFNQSSASMTRTGAEKKVKNRKRPR